MKSRKRKEKGEYSKKDNIKINIRLKSEKNEAQ